MSQGLFLYSRGGRDYFLSLDDLRGRARCGLVQAGDRVYHPGLGRWLYAQEVAELRPALGMGKSEGGESGVLLVPVNGAAVAALCCAVLGALPVLGVPLLVSGVALGTLGRRRAAALYGSGGRMARAALWLCVGLLLAQGALGWVLSGMVFSL